jgi:hypothetical protein
MGNRIPNINHSIKDLPVRSAILAVKYARPAQMITLMIIIPISCYQKSTTRTALFVIHYSIKSSAGNTTAA